MTTRTAGQEWYQDIYLRSWRWRILRTMRRAIDGNRCRFCHEPRGLQVHHADYTSRGRNFMRELFSDTITVCTECHEKLHGK